MLFFSRVASLPKPRGPAVGVPHETEAERAFAGQLLWESLALEESSRESFGWEGGKVGTWDCVPLTDLGIWSV